MEPFTSSFLLLLFVLTSILPSKVLSGPILAGKYCSNGPNFTANSTYQSNLRQLLHSVASSATPSGFNASTIGSPPNRIQALALCGGQIPVDDCKSCLKVATSDAEQNCPYAKSATIFYYGCHIRYSDQSFINTVNTTIHCFWGWNFVSSSDTERYNASARRMLEYLRNYAVYNATSSPLFAQGEMEYGGIYGKLYGLVKCTRDISPEQCGKCLDHIITGKTNSPVMCYNHKRATMAVTGTCGVRYLTSAFWVRASEYLVVPSETSRDGGGEEEEPSGARDG